MNNQRILLRVEEPAADLSVLIRAARTAGHRVGWLELEPPPVVDRLDEAAHAGVLRAVAVGDGRAVAVKNIHGAPVLRDLLREHFSGCRLVLVQGKISAPLLKSSSDGGWTIALPDRTIRFEADAFGALLDKPHPWDRP